MNPQGDTKYTTRGAHDDPAETLQRINYPASLPATSEQQLACACPANSLDNSPDNRDNRAWQVCVCAV